MVALLAVMFKTPFSSVALAYFGLIRAGGRRTKPNPPLKTRVRVPSRAQCRSVLDNALSVRSPSALDCAVEIPNLLA